ncbi:MAG TPA: DNA alkylation repair protein [Candidatus Limnocylindrales bacterium]|nr:DNA alkylation repair protein [Candidatus Limnocylindrales bacterium]
MTSEATRRAEAFVAERLVEARGLGQSLADLIDDPEAFVDVLRDGFERLADGDDATALERITPGAGPLIGVRWPLVRAVANQLRGPLDEGSASSALWLAQRLAEEQEHEVRLFSHVPLRRSLADDPERSWQLMRRLAATATDWTAVDSLADLYARGILADRRRWAELEQLVYSPRRWERRLVGSTLATLPHRLPSHERHALAGAPALRLIESLIGDDEPDVQKALGWALRAWHQVDSQGTIALLRAQAARASRDDDGHRAWVVRDALSLPGMDRRLVLELRDQMQGVRRRPAAPATSEARSIAAAFGGYEAVSQQAIDIQGQRMAASARRGVR